jgi:hypothetical protein
MPPDTTDVRVLIPRTRRALEGPTASASGAPGATLLDEQVEALIADAIADVILNTGGLFGHELIVTERDEVYGAPTAWKTNEELSESESTVIVAQAALSYFFFQIRTMKVSETQQREGQSWTWSISANALTEWIRFLRDQRDRALEVIAMEKGVALDAYESFIAVRDVATARTIEPWVPAVNSSGGQELDDPRFY